MRRHRPHAPRPKVRCREAGQGRKAVTTAFSQGWAALCNGVVVFETPANCCRTGASSRRTVGRMERPTGGAIEAVRTLAGAGASSASARGARLPRPS
ncbi:DUF5999 family protein [Streptomyces longwoodensis]|uniref:DUF5999 family protein n=1 Tax=Streptomyces longwoodensis TaxID=68231 RepID=UPI00352DEEAA